MNLKLLYRLAFLPNKRLAAPLKNSERISRNFPVAKAGFTVIETLTVIVIVGVLAAIAAPGWHAFQLRRGLNTAQDEVFQGFRQAQAEALRSRSVWQVSLREMEDKVQWATHSASTNPTAATWQTLLSGVRVDAANTTVNQQGTVYRLQFNERGQVNGQLGKLTLTTNDSTTLKRCVFASTLLGVLRKAEDEKCQ